MHVNEPGLVIGAVVLLAWSVLTVCCCLCIWKIRREAASWAEFGQEYQELDGELEEIWRRR
jgi:hypothetical protein